MDNIIEFPTKSVRNYSEIERGLREVLHRAGATESITNTVLQNMDEFIRLLSFDFNFSIPVESASALECQFNDFNKAFIEFIRKLLAERLNMEVRRII